MQTDRSASAEAADHSGYLREYDLCLAAGAAEEISGADADGTDWIRAQYAPC